MIKCQSLFINKYLLTMNFSRIKRLCEEKKITLKDLAIQAGVTEKKYVRRRIRGYKKGISNAVKKEETPNLLRVSGLRPHAITCEGSTN